MIRPARTELPGNDLVHASRVLGRAKTARLLLPEGAPPETGWPTCYLLHSYAGNRCSWLLNGTGSGLFDGSLGAVLVFPESGRRWFINDIAGHRYADYFVSELIPAVEESFPCRRAPESRFVGGFSMGGAAAVYLALLRPDVIGTAFSYGGAFYASDRVGDPYTALRPGGCMMPTEAEHDRVWGPPGSEVRQRYDPDRLIAEAARSPLRPAIAIEVGLDDHARVLAQNRRMHRALGSSGIRHEYAERPGDHSWPSAVASAARWLSSTGISSGITYR